jgi:signal transduction histidine kinase
MVDLKFDENLRTFILILIASILSCGTAWLIVHLFISRSVHKLSNSMSELADKKFNFSLDDKKKDEFSSFTSSFSDLSNIISYFQTVINKSRDYLEGIVESTSDIIITVNPTGKILTFNTGAEKP